MDKMSLEPDPSTRTQRKWSLTSFLSGRLWCFSSQQREIRRRQKPVIASRGPKAATALSGRRLKGDVTRETLRSQDPHPDCATLDLKRRRQLKQRTVLFYPWSLSQRINKSKDWKSPLNNPEKASFSLLALICSVELG